MTKLLLKNAVILTMDSHNTIIENGFIATHGKDIFALGPMDTLRDHVDIDEYRILDCKNKIVLPGMINTHSHLSMMVFRSLADDVKDRLKRYLFPLERDAMTHELAKTGAAYAFCELLLGGVTTVQDNYYFEDDIATLADECGIRGVFAETIIDAPSPNSKNAWEAIAYSKDFIQKWHNHGRIIPGVNCHAIYTNSQDHLLASHKLAKEYNVPMSMHVSEMDFEQAGCLKEHHMTPIQYLDSLEILDASFLAAHAILVNEADLQIMAKQNIKVSYNAGSNAKAAKGVAPVMKMRQKGISVSLGTDGPMSGNTIDIFTQLPLVGKIQKLFNNDRSALPPREILKMATIEGARCLGLEAITGSLERGKRADIIVVETNSINMFPIYDYEAVLVYSANPANVETTIVDGNILMHKRKLLTLDMEKIRHGFIPYQENIRAASNKISQGIEA